MGTFYGNLRGAKSGPITSLKTSLMPFKKPSSFSAPNSQRSSAETVGRASQSGQGYGIRRPKNRGWRLRHPLFFELLFKLEGGDIGVIAGPIADEDAQTIGNDCHS